MTQAPDWLNNAVISGIQSLLVMRLENAPAADTINATVDVWLHALMHEPVTWDQARDEMRVYAAFTILQRLREKWPQPRTLLSVMPAREPQASIPPPRSNTMSAGIRQQLGALTHKQRRHASDVGRHELLAVMAKHQGAANGISAEQLANALHCNARHIRVLVTELRMDGEHVCGTPGEGYFMAETPEDLNATCDFLKGRALKSLLLASRMTKISIPDLVGQLKLPT